MKTRNIYWIVAGIINFFVALIHTVLGQLDLVNPLLEGKLPHSVKTEWMGVWHVVTIILFSTSFYLLKNGFKSAGKINMEMARFIAMLYILFAMSFIICSLVMQSVAPQWILLLPIGLLIIFGTKRAQLQ